MGAEPAPPPPSPLRAPAFPQTQRGAPPPRGHRRRLRMRALLPDAAARLSLPRSAPPPAHPPTRPPAARAAGLRSLPSPPPRRFP